MVKNKHFNTMAYSVMTMKGIAYTYSGMEEIAAQEVFDLIGRKSEIKDRFIIFDSNEKELCRLCYSGQSFIKILSVVREFKNGKDIEGFKESIMKCDISKWLNDDRTFAARVILIKDINEERTEIEADIGEAIIYNKSLNKKPKVNLDNPDISFVGVLYDRFYLCVDFSSADLSKREYRIFTHPISIKASLAYAMIRNLNVRKNDVILDPFCGSGTIAIEAAHYFSARPVNFFNKDKFAFNKFMDFDFDSVDKKILKNPKDIKAKIFSYDSQMRHIKAAEKNAKIAGVNSIINFSRTEVDWLDTKFSENSVDKIITHPPQISKLVSKKELEKLYDELFYQADYVLKKGGKIAVLSTEGRIDDMLKCSAEKKGIKLKEVKIIIHGKQKEHVLIFS